MPTTSRIFIKASVIYLILGAVLGALFLVNHWVPLVPGLLTLRSSHVQFLVVGWLTQLIVGVAWWLFPPLASGLNPGDIQPVRRGQAQRGSEPLFWATFVLLNIGILLQAVFEPAYRWSRLELFRFLTGISGLFLLAAALAFVLNMWGRVRELGRKR